MAKAEAEQALAPSSQSQQLAHAASVDSKYPQQQQATAATVPLQGLQLTSQEALHSATRQKCPNCKKTRAFFCYDCLTPLMQGIPQISDLPIDIHIVMHGETNAQATGTHAAVLAPSIKLFRHTDGTSHHRRQPASRLQLPDWDLNTTAVLYPEGPNTPVVGLWGCLETPTLHQQQQDCQLWGQRECRGQQKPQQEQQEKVTISHGTEQLHNERVDKMHTQVADLDLQQQQPISPELHADYLQQQLQQQLLADEPKLLALKQQQQTCGCCQNCCEGSSSCNHCDSCPPAAAVAVGSLVTATAVNWSDCKHEISNCSVFPYKTVVVLEGNWAKARTLLKHPKIAPLPRVQLPMNVRSLFWRRGTGSFRAAVDCGVCTIEAVYLMLKQLQPEPAGKWDDLLWFFSYQRQLVQQKGSYQTRCEMQQNFAALCGYT